MAPVTITATSHLSVSHSVNKPFNICDTELSNYLHTVCITTIEFLKLMGIISLTHSFSDFETRIDPLDPTEAYTCHSMFFSKFSICRL